GLVEEGMLSYEGFRCGLEAMGINCDSDEQFQAFVDEVDEDKSSNISFDEFLCAIQEIKLAQLFNDSFIRAMPQLSASVNSRSSSVTLSAIEYSPDRIRSVNPINQVKSFIYSTKPSWATTYQNMYRASQFVLPEDDSPFDVMTQADLESRLSQLDIGNVMTPPEQLSLFVMEGVLISVQASGENTLWPALKKRLHVSYSKVRQHSTAFLVYTILDACVDELWPISQTFGAKLLMLECLMSMDTRYFDLGRIAACEKQVKGLQMHCKPMREVISKLVTSDDYQGETLQYLADVQEHLTTIEEECEHHLDRCRSLVEEFNNDRASQQNDVSYILALIAAIFLPAQFLTGVYGMNFPYIPETTYYNAYFVWWAVMIIVAGLIVLFFKYKRWL
ncbi:hypothetical protein JM18_005999, partial [Phytophthora kernoviae]